MGCISRKVLVGLSGEVDHHDDRRVVVDLLQFLLERVELGVVYGAGVAPVPLQQTASQVGLTDSVLG